MTWAWLAFLVADVGYVVMCGVLGYWLLGIALGGLLAIGPVVCLIVGWVDWRKRNRGKQAVEVQL